MGKITKFLEWLYKGDDLGWNPLKAWLAILILPFLCVVILAMDLTLYLMKKSQPGRG